MGLTITKLSPSGDYVAGNKRVKVREIAFDSSYPTGGESLTAADVGLRVIEQFLPHGPASDSDGTGGSAAVTVRYDHSTSKLQAFRQIDPADTGGAQVSLPEVASTNSLANYLVRATIVGH